MSLPGAYCRHLVQKLHDSPSPEILDADPAPRNDMPHLRRQSSRLRTLRPPSLFGKAPRERKRGAAANLVKDKPVTACPTASCRSSGARGCQILMLRVW